MATNDKAAKTEKATPKRIREARERGQIARSPDLSAWGGMLLTTVLLEVTLARGNTAMRGLLENMGRVIGDPSQEAASRFFGGAMVQAAYIAAPLVLGLMLLGVVVNLAQVGLKPSVKRLKPDFGRLNALKGAKRMVSVSSLWELFKSVAKVVLLLFVAWPIASSLAHELASGGGSATYLAAHTAKGSLKLMRNVSAVSLVVAATDYGVQRRRINKELMMSRHEVQEELKQYEGNPQMKSAIRSRQQAMSRNRMIRLVGQADVVIVNPTHYAVALKYDPERGAPEVVAKGVEHLAARIRLEATRAGVPIVREPALARTVYGACDIGQLIPVALYEAIAQLLAFVYRLKAQGRADGYHEPRVPFLAVTPSEVDLRETKREHRRASRRGRRSTAGTASR
jgi:flagellar biosynthetic protein FlhB